MFKRALFPAIFIFFSLAGLVASFTLAEEYYYLDLPKVEEGGPAIFHRLSAQACGDQNSFFSCATVAKSKYAALFGLPLAVYGLFFYLVVFGLACAMAFCSDALRRTVAVPLFWVTLLGVVEALVLLAITLGAVKAMCPLCLATYIFNLLLFAAVVFFFFRVRLHPLRPIAASGAATAAVPRGARIIAPLALAAMLAAAAGAAWGADLYLRQSKARFIAANKDKEIQRAVEAFARQKPEAIDFISLHVRGPADAPVKIIEISDFLCPYCAHAADLMDRLAAANPGKINIRFVNLPLDMACNRFMRGAMHRGACDLAIGAVCAADQGGLDAYQREAFALHKSQPTPEDFRSAVLRAGLSEEVFIQCLRRPDSLATLRTKIEQTHQYGITSTPTVFINAKRFQGRLSLEALQKIVDMETQTAEAKQP
jgi:protein-disulfide isomerase/uncharacterized membrane protein